MKYWYYSKAINHLIENTAINSGNISLVIKEIGNILGKDISLQLEDNLPYSNLLKLSCPPFTIYKLSLFGKDYFYNENETLCPCADKINTNNNFIVSYSFNCYYSVNIF